MLAPGRAPVRVESRFYLETEGGQSVDVAWELGGDLVGTYIRGRPASPLAPRTTYRVLHGCDPSVGAEYADAGFGDPNYCRRCDSSERSEVLRFTTGDGLDDTAPRAPQLGPVELDPTTEAAPSNSCSNWSLCAYRIAELEPEPDTMLRVRRSGSAAVISDEPPDGISGVQLLTSPVHSALLVATDGKSYGYDAPLSGGTFVVTRVDSAGNESAPAMVDVPPCSPLQPDAGVPEPSRAVDAGVPGTAPADASPDATPATSARQDDVGCSASRTPAPGTAAVAVALVLLVARRKRPRGARRRARA